MADNLYPHLKCLNKKEKAVLCAILKHKWEFCHMGTLPFMNYKESLKYLECWATTANSWTIYRRICQKLRNNPIEGEIVNLPDGKVFQRFGKHPERGVVIPGLPTWHRPRARKMFESKKDCFEVAQYIVSLKHIGQNRWYVSCPKHLYPRVINWLQNNLR